MTMASIEADLRHMTSSGLLSSPRSTHRASQHIRIGSRSPTSIPSSPTSVHSSSSAIFERDIEPIVPPSPPFFAHQNPHRIPRAKGTEQLEHSVPSVLDSAAAILTSLEDYETVDHVAVVAPAATAAPLDSILARSTNSGIASPIGSFRSRSPSPLGLRVAPGHGPIPRTELLLNIPPTSATSPTTTTNPHVPSGSTSLSSPPQSAPPSIVAPPFQRSTFETNTAVAPIPPAIVTPTSASLASGESSPTATSCDQKDVNVPTSALQSTPSPPSAPAPAYTGTPVAPSQSATSQSGLASQPAVAQPSTLASPNLASPTSWPSTVSHPPSPTHGAAKRLSFMSYSDLLSSTPASTLPLSSLTTSASSSEPPPHIPSVSGLNIANAVQTQGNQQHLGLTLGPPAVAAGSGVPASVKGVTGSAATSLRGFVIGPMGGITHAGKRDSIAMLDDVGGEWEREGMGKGLEERLEALIGPTPPLSQQPVPAGVVPKV